IEIIPIEHTTMVLKWAGKIIYVDPVGGAKVFVGQEAPDIILLTHDHSDHFDVKTLQAVAKDKTLIVAPMKVADLVPNTVPGTLLVAKNGQKTNQQGFKIEVIPAYNLPDSEKDFHPKGEGNGYVLETNGKRIYISGDTAGTSEVHNLKNIDIAFVAMNLPYTMSIEKATEAVLEFKPKKVYPYHYRTPTGFSDVVKFKKLVNEKNSAIEVVQLNWYPK
ncbi:MAG: MBL fold metallo-hydrolase, partial [Patescibacteria group bacterium]